MTETKKIIPPEDAESFTFGDNETLCDELLELVRSGKKTATCGEMARQRY